MIINDARLFSVKEYAGMTGRDIHIDAILSGMTLGYKPVGAIADRIFPVINVTKQSDGYYIWSRADKFRRPDAERAPKTLANRIDTKVSTDTYFAKNYALGVETSWEDLSNADAALELRSNNSDLIIDALTLNHEVRVANRICNTSNVGSSNSLASDYSNVGATAPIDDLDNGIESIRSVTGMTPNKAIFGPKSWMRFRKHPDVIDFVRGKGDNIGGGGVTLRQVADAWMLDEVLVGNAIVNTAAEGDTGVYSDVWSNHIALLYVAPRPGRMVATYGMTFAWQPAGFPARRAVRRYDDSPKMIEIQEVHEFQDEKITGTELGYLIIGA
jgi:hypothetical protein